jgi:hypothetical protein
MRKRTGRKEYNEKDNILGFPGGKFSIYSFLRGGNLSIYSFFRGEN